MKHQGTTSNKYWYVPDENRNNFVRMKTLPGYESNDCFGDFDLYRANPYVGPVIVSDITCDYAAHSPYVASLDYDDYFYTREHYGPCYNMTLTCNNPHILRRILELIREYDFSDCGIDYKKCLNTTLTYVGKVDKEEDLPKIAKPGEVCIADNKMFVYGGDGWEMITDMVQDEEETECKMEAGKYKRRHRVLYGAM